MNGVPQPAAIPRLGSDLGAGEDQLALRRVDADGAVRTELNGQHPACQRVLHLTLLARRNGRAPWTGS